MALALILVPLSFALLALVIRSNHLRPWCVPAGASVHLGLMAVSLARPHVAGPFGWLVLDDIARLVLAIVSVLYFVCSFYAVGYLAEHPERDNRAFCACLLGFIAGISLVAQSQHLGLMWVALETTTLASAPLLYFNRDPRSLEATWKYLLIGSVGIALALLGTLFLAYAALSGGTAPSLHFADVLHDAPMLSRPWLRSAFVLLFIGYGTKMGLAPMHAWKPDAYGEAPGVCAALLAGGLTHAAFLAILRFYRITVAAHDPGFAQHMMMASGLLSMGVAAVFMARQRDYKRMLAYSSVEHMGLLVLGVGIGGAGIFGSMLHMVNNAFTKALLFLAAANIQRAYASKKTEDVRGALVRLPVSGALFLLGFFAIAGAPPFGPFLSEFTILNAAVRGGHYVVFGVMMVMLAVVFLGMGATVLSLVQGAPSEKASSTDHRERFMSAAPAVLLLSMVFVLGVYVPPPLDSLLRHAARALEGTP